MADIHAPYIRSAMLAGDTPPMAEKGTIRWLRRNLFATPKDAALTILALLFLTWVVPHAVNWLFVKAVWSGADRSVCATTDQGGIQPADWGGACWAYAEANFGKFLFGRYPMEERWRPILTALLFLALFVPLAIPKVPRKGLNIFLLLVAFPIVAYILLLGGIFGLSHVETTNWGGLMVTLVISFIGIGFSIPAGILLALGRRSKMPVIKALCVIFIEVIRGVPLITVLFMASVMLPLFLPNGVNFDKFLRALVGVSIFSAAYMAEVIRGGLQAIPKGQSEGADSLGLSFWQKIWLVIMPQAIKLVIPGIVNTCIGMFKDTSLVSIIGMFDLLGIITQSFSDTAWASAVTPATGLILAAFIYWLFCFGMSRYSQFMERYLDTGHKR